MIFIPYVVFFFFFFAYTYQYAVNQRHFFFKNTQIYEQKQDFYEEHNNIIFKNHYIFLWSKSVIDKTAFS